MAINKKHSRPITVENIKFRYKIDCDWSSQGEHGICITVQNEETNASKLFIESVRGRDLGRELNDEKMKNSNYPVITPKHIEHLIKNAIADGWNHNKPGKVYSYKIR